MGYSTGNKLSFCVTALLLILSEMTVFSLSAPLISNEDEYLGSLDILHSSVEHAFRRFIHKRMDCYTHGGCQTNPTTLKLTNMPKFRTLNSQGEGNQQILQENYEALHTYQYFIDNHLRYSTEAKSAKLTPFLKTTSEAFDKVIAHHSSYMISRSCGEPRQYIEEGYSILPAPSQILEKVRIYEFLRQYTEFLTSFEHTYERLKCN